MAAGLPRRIIKVVFVTFCVKFLKITLDTAYVTVLAICN